MWSSPPQPYEFLFRSRENIFEQVWDRIFPFFLHFHFHSIVVYFLHRILPSVNEETEDENIKSDRKKLAAINDLAFLTSCDRFSVRASTKGKRQRESDDRKLLDVQCLCKFSQVFESFWIVKPYLLRTVFEELKMTRKFVVSVYFPLYIEIIFGSGSARFDPHLSFCTIRLTQAHTQPAFTHQFGMQPKVSRSHNKIIIKKINKNKYPAQPNIHSPIITIFITTVFTLFTWACTLVHVEMKWAAQR